MKNNTLKNSKIIGIRDHLDVELLQRLFLSLNHIEEELQKHLKPKEYNQEETQKSFVPVSK